MKKGKEGNGLSFINKVSYFLIVLWFLVFVLYGVDSENKTSDPFFYVLLITPFVSLLLLLVSAPKNKSALNIISIIINILILLFAIFVIYL